MSREILLTGFKRYGNERTNPTSDIVERLDGRTIQGCRIVGHKFKVAASEVSARMPSLIDSHQPRLILSLGLAPRRMHITPERVALNVADFSIPDRERFRPVDKPIDPSGPAAYFATIPVKKIVRTLLRNGIPSSVSNTAGTYLCNYVMYVGLNHVAKSGTKTLCGFIHVPYTMDQAAEKSKKSREQVASMDLDMMVKAIEIAIRTSIRH